MSEIVRIAYAELSRKVATALEAAGVPAVIAALEAEVMAEADLTGVPSHGVRMLPPLLAALKDGRVTAAPDIRLKREFGATSLLDGDNGPGRTTSCHAMNDAVARARQFGIGACLAMHTTHWGRAHAYAYRAAQQGMIGICTTNAMPTMAVWGGTGKIIGNNPLAISIPRAETQAPLVLDMAMSQAAVGKVGTWLREGREVPQGWGLDASGQPSTDAKAILGGAVLPFGGHKGAGLALMMELLTAALAGGAFGNEIIAGDRSGLDPDSCKLFIALNPAAFGGTDVFEARVADYLAYLGQDAAPFTWPGERGWTERDENLVQGVPLHTEIVAQLAAVGVVI
ncbi:Ldh family oxidoreductase [Uliginosibacterium sp. 31-16]|uniref:Ldh family oxidoreductase n=1 Tax=Uliginosibacterium sp. 31-16 TaxID=3068315 RepID=UPI00273E9F27|nr:Ldh family oxidoreductase [Uliginosibacterium sp. 31-16]MDP5240579.1 Ldh family oxidoreductase [Uliginosibacterium sp. 31-16]